MRTATKPLLFTPDSLTWRPYLADPARASVPPWRVLIDSPDIRLISVWHDLRELTVSLNLAHQTKRTISPVLFQEVLISVQYRLHHLLFNKNDIQETLRLIMLVFSASLFLDVHCRPWAYEHLAHALKDALRGLQSKTDGLHLELQLWLAFIVRMTVLTSAEDWLWLQGHMLTTMRALELKSWAEARQVLKSFLWADVLHDKRGEGIYLALAATEPT
jgi:hypothetical protein